MQESGWGGSGLLVFEDSHDLCKCGRRKELIPSKRGQEGEVRAVVEEGWATEGLRGCTVVRGTKPEKRVRAGVVGPWATALHATGFHMCQSDVPLETHMHTPTHRGVYTCVSIDLLL